MYSAGSGIRIPEGARERTGGGGISPKERKTMPGLSNLKNTFLTVIMILSLGTAFAIADDDSDVEKLPLAPNDPDITDVCTLSDCNPAKPCADPDENCYTLNGVFYCCTTAPDPGMEAVGD
ncbi:MAG: hypothetical protein A3J42_08035 [Candidatus Dadabacteria bacterium RIFCSPHIGHO2_12_FULL_53_21]|nr:MAG: hypothetical protein A3J42_08035 [Candidatus Dadabacteria bacterium RIFCSPHIGHO2_12_FULL_53_21]